MNNQYHVALSDKLSRTGLSQKEAIIYAFLLEREGAFPSVIAKETGLNRTTVYKILTTLSTKGLVTEFEKQKKFFYQAENPKQLEKYAESQISLAKSAKEYVEHLMPVLGGIYKNSSDKPVVKFFEGKDGVTAIYDDHVQVKKSYEMLAFSNTTSLLPVLDEEFKQYYVARKVKNKITTRAIVPIPDGLGSDPKSYYGSVPYMLIPKLKYLSKELFSFNADLTLYGENKISIVNFNQPHFVGTVMQDQTIYNMLKLFFELTWKSLPDEAEKH